MDRIVLNAAGCGSATKEYGRLLAGEPGWGERASAFAAKVRDVSELLAELPPVAVRHPVPGRVAYHDACHLAHAQGVRSQPRAMLSAIPGLTLVEIADGDQCCGSAGIYNIVEPESARESAWRTAIACPAMPPPRTVTVTVNCVARPVLIKGSSAASCNAAVGK